MAFEVIKSGWSVFQKGKAVANPATWKASALSVQTMLALLTAVVGLLRANGYDLPVSDETLTQLATGIVALVFGIRGVLNVITDKDKGVKASPASCCATALSPERTSTTCDHDHGEG